MKHVVTIVAILGIVGFLMSVGMRIMHIGMLLRASPSGWWNASSSMLAIAITLALLQIRDSLQQRP